MQPGGPVRQPYAGVNFIPIQGLLGSFLGKSVVYVFKNLRTPNSVVCLFRLGKVLFSQDFKFVYGLINYNFGLSPFIFYIIRVKILSFFILFVGYYCPPGSKFTRVTDPIESETNSYLTFKYCFRLLHLIEVYLLTLICSISMHLVLSIVVAVLAWDLLFYIQYSCCDCYCFRLYDLASKHARVVELLNKLLSQVITAPPITGKLLHVTILLAKSIKIAPVEDSS